MATEIPHVFYAVMVRTAVDRCTWTGHKGKAFRKAPQSTASRHDTKQTATTQTRTFLGLRGGGTAVKTKHMKCKK